MRKSIIILLAILGLSTCSTPQHETVMLDLFGDQRGGTGVGTLQDFYKQHFQAFYGAEHMAPDTASVLAYLDYELAQTDYVDSLPDLQEIGDYVRVSLALVKKGVISREELAYAFIESAQPVQHEEDEWLARWQEVEKEVLKAYPYLANDTLQADLLQAAQLNAAVHHSQPFHNTYHPHYRIIRKDIVSQWQQRGL